MLLVICISYENTCMFVGGCHISPDEEKSRWSGDGDFHKIKAPVKKKKNC